jgi:hypothetical protein
MGKSYEGEVEERCDLVDGLVVHLERGDDFVAGLLAEQTDGNVDRLAYR